MSLDARMYTSPERAEASDTAQGHSIGWVNTNHVSKYEYFLSVNPGNRKLIALLIHLSAIVINFAGSIKCMSRMKF